MPSPTLFDVVCSKGPSTSSTSNRWRGEGSFDRTSARPGTVLSSPFLSGLFGPRRSSQPLVPSVLPPLTRRLRLLTPVSYDLVVVPKDKATGAHVVMSSTGVVMVNPGGESERFSLDEWARQRGLFEACSKLGFFRQFLLAKSFRAWRQVHVARQIMAARERVAAQGLLTSPVFRPALVACQGHLLQLESTRLFPVDASRPYTVAALEEMARNGLVVARRRLDAQVELVSEEIIVVEHSIRTRVASLRARLQEMAHPDAKASMSAVAERRRCLLQELHDAEADMGRMQGFVRLVDQMMLQRLRQLALTTLRDDWIKTLEKTEARNGLFVVNFVSPLPSLSSLHGTDTPVGFLDLGVGCRLVAGSCWARTPQLHDGRNVSQARLLNHE